MRRLIVIAGVLLSTSAWSQDQFNNLGYRWLPPAPIQYDVYYLNSEGIGFGNVQTAVDGAWAAWAGTGCSWISGHDDGIQATTNNPADLVNDMAVWVASSSDPNYNFALGGGSEASAAVPYTFAGQIYGCDVYLNAFDFTYSVSDPPPPSSLDLQSQMTHEVGHCLGLGDEYSSSDLVMYPGLAPGTTKRQLTTTDVEDLCQYYPTNGYDAPCSGAGQGTCAAGQSLNCINFGAPAGHACTVGCTVPAPGDPNPCLPPFVCLASAAIAGFSGVCSPNTNAVTLVGNPCPGGDISQCGSFSATCIPQGSLPSGTIAWQNGYCTQACTPSPDNCPQGSMCYATGSGNECLKQCQLGGTDCRQFYSCSPLVGLPNGVGACVTSCANDLDCVGGSCRGCDGVCFSKNTPTSQIGDSCILDGDCGVGQFCLTFAGHSAGVCTQTCSQTCGACPTGTDCQDVKGSAVCLRDCETYTCAAQEQCQYFPLGRGCVPACTFDTECFSGYHCILGQCSPLTEVDAGCQLCFSGPTDTPPTGTDLDAGISGVNAGGCGCQVGSGIVILPLLVFAFALWERRRWQHR